MDVTWNPRGVTYGMSHVVHLCEWITLSHVSKERNKGKKIKKLREKNVRVTSGKGESGGKFPPLIDQFG